MPLQRSVACALFVFSLAAAAAEKPVDFDRQIRPILSDKCYKCHGPDDKARMANLRLDSRDSAFAKRAAYQIIAPGDSAHSRLYQKISAANAAQRMPPAWSGLALAPEQVELIKAWIDQGAKWETHWAYVPPKRPPVPAVGDASWVRNPIDNFILARLEKEGLKPSPEADKVTLLRRVTFDLTGLPPAPQEIDSFLADKSGDAYEKRVDALLASPHYGERMAMHWMDLARYSDTHGYHIDSAREMWHWRDWVINAYNHNMPYDEFSIEQLAGDLLPHATLPQQIATGFNRNHMINFEGGAIPEEYQVEYVVDRASTTATVWLGLTMGCARCHDHKYDPIRQKEFYEFYAFFNNIPEKGLDGRKGNAEPIVQIPSPEQQKELDELKGAIPAHEKMLEAAEVKAAQAAWEKTAQITEAPRSGLVAQYELDGNFADTTGHNHTGRVIKGDITFGDAPVGKGAEFDGETLADFGKAGGFDRGDAFSVALWARQGDKREIPVLQKLDPATHRGWELAFDEAPPVGDLKRGSHITFRLVHQQPADEIEVRTKQHFILGDWHHISAVYDGSGQAAGIRLYVEGKPQELDIVRDALTGPIANDRSLQIGDTGIGLPFKGRIDDLRIYSRALSGAEVTAIAVDHPVRAVLEGQYGKRTKEQAKAVRDYYFTNAAAPELRRCYAELKDLEARQKHLDDVVPTSMVMAEMKQPRDTWVLGRGDYRNRLEKVDPGVPAILPPLPKDAPLNRLTLARWLMSPRNPLTARVAVNRFWQLYFGTGIVKTAEDFGSQGEPPSHAELLDWLATEFERGWDIKALQRLIVTSATYRQASESTPELNERDPENRLLAHGPRFRLPAEMIRDNALAAGGLLNHTVGGAPVLPYQPKGLWEEMAFGDVYSAQTYVQSHGPDLYRRSVYTFFKRTVPPPSLLTFDTPDREKCTARRTLTNTPLQALELLNDPEYVEAARALAERTLEEAGRDPARRIRYAFRLAAARTPATREVQVLRDLARKELLHYRHDPTGALKLLRVGESPYNTILDPTELAAWTTVASTILNLDETITKE